MIISCSCGKQLSINESLAGKKVKCPGCGNIFVAPAPSGSQQASPPPPPPPATRPSPPPPDPSPRRRRPINPDGELSFDCPSVRAERLMVLTKGEEPVELYHLGKAILTRSGSQVNWFVDVVVCDMGLLVVPYTHHNPAQHAAHGGGLIGAAIGAVASSMAYSKANKIFLEQSAETQGWEPTELFTGVTKHSKSGGRCSKGVNLMVNEQMGAELLPADELSSWKTPSKKIIEVKWRNRTWKFQRPDDLDKECNRAWDQLRDELDEWQENAAALLESRSGGPDDPGLPALLEWAHRPDDEMPSWVQGTVNQLADTDLSKPIKKFAVPWETVGRLAGRLKQINGGEEMARQLQDLNNQQAMPLWISFLITLILGVLGVFASLVFSVQEDGEEALIVISWVVTGILLFVALILGIMTWEVKGGFSKGLKAVSS
jgi:hypothetical protein